MSDNRFSSHVPVQETYDDVMNQLDKVSALVEVALNAGLNEVAENVLFQYFSVMAEPVVQAKGLMQRLCCCLFEY